MKKAFLRIIFVLQLILVPIFTGNIFADPPGPPNPGGSPVPGSGGHGLPVGGPIDDGLGVLLALGIVYGAYRFYEIWKNKRSVNSKKEAIKAEKVIGTLILVVFFHYNFMVY